MPLVGIGHLTMLDTAPPDWVSLAQKVGFDAVGIRVAPIGPTEEEWPMRVGSPMLAETLRRMADTGVRVLDSEIIVSNRRRSLRSTSRCSKRQRLWAPAS